MTTGLEGFAQSAGAMAAQADGLRAAVDSGQVVMDPEAAENLAKFYDEKADDLSQARRRADRLVVNGAFGDCNTGRGLEQKFRDKAQQAEAGAVPILAKMENTLRDLAKTVRDAKRDTQANDDEQARELGKNL